jgi:signal transduction histidine kinase
MRAPGWSIRIMSSAADLERTLSKLDYWFLVGAPIVAILSGLVGWALAGRLLQPVDAMATAAEQTGTTNVVRLPVENPDDELGRLGASFNGLLERLDDALSQQRRFLADAAHELRTPIARMSTLAELALSRPNEDAGASLARISTDLHHASRLLDELLQLARADAGERMQRRERVFLDDVAMDAIAAWNPVAMRAGVPLVMGDVEESPVRINPLLARRLIDTLLENAVRYTASGGQIEASVRRSGDRIVLVVSDSGIGIPSDELPRIFERFFRGTRSRAMAPEGSGLGLPIAAWIVDQCGGSIDVASGSAGGTSVRVSLPMDATPHESTASREPIKERSPL